MSGIFLSLDKSGTLIYLSQQAESALRIDRAHSLHQPIWTIFPRKADSVYVQLYHQAQLSGETTQQTVFADCLACWLVIRIYPSPEGMLVQLDLCREPVAAEPHLRQLAQVAQHTSLSIVITDAQGATEWVNESFTKQTGYTLADMLGKKPGQVLQGPDTEQVAVRRCRERLMQQVPFSFTVLNYTKKGQKLWLLIDISPVHDENGQLTQYIAIQQNITFRKEAEASQDALKQKLYLQNQHLQQFAYTIGHELRVPLATAQELATQLAQGGETAPATTLASLCQHIGRANATLQQLDGILALQDAPLALPPQKPVRLAPIGKRLLAELREPLQQCGGTVVFEAAPRLVLRANREYLYTVLYHLVANAIQCRSEERPLRVTIQCYASAATGVTISLVANGSGFNRYKAGADGFQLYKYFAGKPQGQGLSLFLVKAYVDAMGGKIEVSSSADIGTHFLLHFNVN